MTIGWSDRLFIVDGDAPAVDQLGALQGVDAPWLVIERLGGALRYVFSYEELLDLLRRTHVAFDPDSPSSLADVLGLHEWQASGEVRLADLAAAVIDASRAGAAGPSGLRLVVLDDAGRVSAIGGEDVDAAPEPVWAAAPASASADPFEAFGATRGGAPSAGADAVRGDPFGAIAEPAAAAGAEPAPASSAEAVDPGGIAAGAGDGARRSPRDDDEGTAPIRHPSIEPRGELVPAAPVTLVVDLLREASSSTSGGPLSLGTQAADWQTLDIGVTLVSPAIDFERSGRGRVTIHRNAASVPAEIHGRVLDDVAPGTDVEVHAQFWSGTRYSGGAVRVLRVAAAPAAHGTGAPSALPDRAAPPAGDARAGASGGDAPAALAAFAATAAAPGAAVGTPARTSAGATGAIRVEPDAEPPDLTVFITLFDKERPGRMHWRMTTEPFDALPPKLDAIIDVGQDPASEAAARFKEFANLERGQHRESIEGFGEKLWDSAPPEFQAVYWALHDHYRRPLSIQFVSDDPYLPWELMRPYRDGETHPPLAVRHAVARWIGRWHGYMRNRLRAGRLIAIAPKYKTVSARLTLAEAAAARLVASFGAEAVDGTWPSLNELLVRPSGAPIGLLYFTGHGVFSGDAAASAIKLTDRAMKVTEVGRREVSLGERDGTLVFFNACEVGATGRLLGSVGGWADAFLSRRFRAFIAPLWAIDEEDAAQVTDELLARIIRERVPVGAALRDLRAAHGDVSPTFYSYLLFGDVTARVESSA
ncbi:TCAD7 domain-containing protein [Piscinibacter koreensis]|uniref:Ternary complex associated domain-containing protein n=1 Tax=Piscinibacter koreensis TaxID=2742824 RepID=A0A7Y6TW98_9BURK|nr:TCAD7 domain-containing protein [Schlegelella koreensis]NUZ05855.1 hypothetical protein [Schlegelella koreensis]